MFVTSVEIVSSACGPSIDRSDGCAAILRLVSCMSRSFFVLLVSEEPCVATDVQDLLFLEILEILALPHQ